MREILFRGKSVNGIGWIEGSLRVTTIQPADGASFKSYEIEDTTCGVYPNDFMSGICEIVDPETVGQFTGLTDKNGKKVFEGDILRFTDTNADYEWFGYVEFGNPNAEYNWGFQLVYIKGTKANTDILCWFDMEDTGAFAEVIGNIHDIRNCWRAEDGK